MPPPGDAGREPDLLRAFSPQGVSEQELLRVAGLLEDAGLHEAWQFKFATRPILETACRDPLTLELDYRAFLLVSAVAEKVQQAAAGGGNGSSAAAAGPDFQAESVAALRAIARRARVGAARQRGDRSVSSDSDDKASTSVNVCKGLKRYGLNGLPVEHLPQSALLQPLLRRSRRKAGHGRLPWVAGELQKDFEPLKRASDATLRPPQKGQAFQSFAHFTSCWWARALSQLALQADLNSEAVTFERLLRRFLDLCHMAQELGVTVAYEYDRQEWLRLGTQIENKGPSVDPDASFEKIDHGLRADVKDQCSRAKQAGDSSGRGGSGASRGPQGHASQPARGHAA
ncbi:unnamed protein product, partial [Prorocentrum cordatum]